MAINNLQTYFLTKKALRNEKITTRELSLLVGMGMLEANGAGRSIQAIQRHCEFYGHCWHYRTCEMLIKTVMDKNLVAKKGRNVHVNANGMLLLNRIDRKLQKVVSAAAA